MEESRGLFACLSFSESYQNYQNCDVSNQLMDVGKGAGPRRERVGSKSVDM
jgi:hypothetical protein